MLRRAVLEDNNVLDLVGRIRLKMLFELNLIALLFS